MNSLSLREFFISDANEIFLIPNTQYSRMLDGSVEKNIEKFSGKRIRTAEIIVELKNKRPVKVRRTVYSYLHFSKEGILDYNRMSEDQLIVGAAGIDGYFGEDLGGNIIDKRQEFAKKQRDNSVWWTPSVKLEKKLFDSALAKIKTMRL